MIQIDYFDPIMYGGSNPDKPEFTGTPLPSVTPEENIPAVTGAPVEVEGERMYTSEYKQPTGSYYDPIGNKDYPDFESARAAMNPPNMYDERRRMKSAGFTPAKFGGSTAAATKAYRKKNKPQAIMESGLMAEGTGTEPAPSVKLAQSPGTSTLGPGVIPARMGYEFMATHGSTDQQNIAAERLEELKNLAPGSKDY